MNSGPLKVNQLGCKGIDEHGFCFQELMCRLTTSYWPPGDNEKHEWR